jgi:uroporphyrinogen-III synthase
MRTIALTRARDAAERSAARLAERGFASVVAPVTRVRATGAGAPPGPHDVVVATSARALELLSAPARASIEALPLFVVGDRSAWAAVERGLRVADAPAIDVVELTGRLLARLAPASRVLYLAGEDRRSDLERTLAEAGHGVSAVEIYVAEARADWSAEEAGALARCDAALHYSRRSAELALRLAEAAGIADRFRAMLHVCLSREAAAPFLAWEAPRLRWAPEPREDALFDALAWALAEPV